MPKKLFLTISPADRTLRYAKLKFKNPLQCCYYDDLQIIQNVLRRNKIKHYVIYPEIDPKGRLHYHGRLTVSPSQYVSVFKSVKPILAREIGYVDITEVKHDLENLIYCMKSFGQTQSMLDISSRISLYDSMKKPLKPLENTSQPSVLDYFTVSI